MHTLRLLLTDALREPIMPTTRQIYQKAPSQIDIPQHLQQRPLEVIFQPLDENPEQTTETDEKGWPVGFFEKTAGCLADDPIKRWPQD